MEQGRGRTQPKQKSGPISSWPGPRTIAGRQLLIFLSDLSRRFHALEPCLFSLSPGSKERPRSEPNLLLLDDSANYRSMPQFVHLKYGLSTPRVRVINHKVKDLQERTNVGSSPGTIPLQQNENWACPEQESTYSISLTDPDSLGEGKIAALNSQVKI